MKSQRFLQQNLPWNWALITAFILFSVFTLAQHAYMTSVPDNAEKMRHVYSFGIAGCFLGVLLLPFLLPLKRFQEHCRPAKYKLRLIITAFFFLPNIIIRLLGEEVYLSNPVNSGIMALGNGVIITLMHGFVFSMTGKYRLFWITLAFSAGNLAFSFITGQAQQALQPFLFFGSGLFLLIAGIFLFVYLTNYRFNDIPKNEENKFDPSESKPIPYFLFPLLAAFIIFTTNSFSNQLFFMVLNSPLPPGFNFSNLMLILTLPLLGFLASLSWRRFLMIFIPVCSVILLLAPSLLLFPGSFAGGFTHSQPLFLILYTLNTITVRMITAVFPFIIVDMYWRFLNNKKTNNPFYLIIIGCLCWLLPVSINIISMFATIPNTLFNLILHDKPTAVTFLTIAAIAFYILMWLVNKNIRFNGRNNAAGITGTETTGMETTGMETTDRESTGNFSAVSAINLETFFKEYDLTDKEIEVARLLFEEGLTSEEIAGRIFRSTATVSSHLTNIFRKLNVQSRTEFMAKVRKG